MPLVLMVLFAIALLITLAGFFLSQKNASSRSHNDYLVTSKGRRIVEATPIPARTRRIQGTNTARTRSNLSGMDIEVARPRMVISRASAGIDRPRANAGGAGIVSPDLWEPLFGRLGSWKIVLPGLIILFLLGFYLVSFTLPHQIAWTSPWFSQASTQSSSQPESHPVYTASEHLSRIYQLDPAQYQSTADYNNWAYSACSAAAMTEVINSYGHHYRIADILKVESQIGEITPQEGLLEESGIQHTGTKFGFKTTWGDNVLNLDQLIAAANSGTPVIISFPPSTYAGGHILVVRGGNKSYVYLADSSRLDWTQLTRTRFMQLWRGFSAIMTPA